jgi:hypothetical protein
MANQPISVLPSNKARRYFAQLANWTAFIKHFPTMICGMIIYSLPSQEGDSTRKLEVLNLRKRPKRSCPMARLSITIQGKEHVMIELTETQRRESIPTKQRWTAAELRKLPAVERDAIMAAAAHLAVDEYRNNAELTAFEAFGKDDLSGESSNT